MNRTLKLCVVSGLALVLGAGMAMADSKAATKKRKAISFENLFNGSGKRNSAENQQKRRLFGRNLDDRSSSESMPRASMRIVNGQNANKRKKPNVVVASDDGDPEGDPGLGMGNLPYVSAKLVPVNGVKLSEPRPADAPQGAIYDQLSGTGDSFRVIAEVRDALVEQYRQQNFRPMWIENGKLSVRGAAC